MIKSRKPLKAQCHSYKPVYARGLCQSCYNKWLRQNNPEFAERQRENCRKWSEKYRQKKRENDKKYSAKKCKIYRSIKSMMSNYGITPADCKFILEKQDGKCFICCKSELTTKRLHIDHDHTTGEIRGLLCPCCNYALGMFQDDPERLNRAANYLKSNPIISELKNRIMAREIEEKNCYLEEAKIFQSAKTKKIEKSDKEEIARLSNEGCPITQLCKFFPQYSKSAIQRARSYKEINQ